MQRREEGGYPHPGWFLAKSAQANENNRVEVWVSAKKCKRVRKNMKIKDEWLIGWRKTSEVFENKERNFALLVKSDGEAGEENVEREYGTGWRRAITTYYSTDITICQTLF
jgi:hypothetical protein